MFFDKFLENENFGKLRFWDSGFRIWKIKIRRVKDLKIPKNSKNWKFGTKIQNASRSKCVIWRFQQFGKSIFFKNLAGSFEHLESDRFLLLRPNFASNFAKIPKNTQKFAPNRQNFPKEKILPTGLKTFRNFGSGGGWCWSFWFGCELCCCPACVLGGEFFFQGCVCIKGSCFCFQVVFARNSCGW